MFCTDRIGDIEWNIIDQLYLSIISAIALFICPQFLFSLGWFCKTFIYFFSQEIYIKREVKGSGEQEQARCFPLRITFTLLTVYQIITVKLEILQLSFKSDSIFFYVISNNIFYVTSYELYELCYLLFGQSKVVYDQLVLSTILLILQINFSSLIPKNLFSIKFLQSTQMF